MKIRTLNFLPEIFQTPTNAQFLNATLDQLVNGPATEKIQGYIGSKIGYGINANDYYVTEPNKTRTDYQLDPGVVFTKPNESVAKDFLSYPGILDALKLQGGVVENNSSLFSAPFYSWDSFCNLDTLINYNEYYWLPEGPPAVIVKSPFVYPENNYIVNDTEQGYSIQVEGDNTVNNENPILTLLRGGTYTFQVNQGTGFYIQGEPGISGTSFLQPNLSVRDILGVTNNGIDVGTITFNVPLKTAQDEYNFATSLNVDLVCTIPYSSVNGQTLSAIGGSIDGVTSLNGLNILFYNTSSGVGSESTNLYTITTSGSQTNPTITLTAGTAIPTNVKLNVQYGTTYLGRSFYRNTSGVITIIPYLSAELDTLYYQDSQQPSKVGIIKLVDTNSTVRINVDTEILGQTNYTSPNGVVFTNGLKVIFDGDIYPTSYGVGQYYVQGVGSAIELVNTNQLVNFEAYTSLVANPYDILPFDIGNFDYNLNVPLEQDYITIARNSVNNNPWSRSNRWFHIDVIKDTATYNNDSSIVTTYASYENKAKRPIIEFYPNLRLFDTGVASKGLVDFVDVRTGDALSFVGGQYNYYPDTNVYTDYTATITGVVSGTSTTITVTKADVTGTFAVGQYISDIYQSPTVSVIPNNATITSITGTTTLTITISWSGNKTFATTNDAQLVATNDPLSNYQLFDGAKIVFVNDSNLATKTKIYVVNFETVDTSLPQVITLTEVVDGQILEDNQFVTTRGALYVGRTFYFDGTSYQVAQQKTSVNQAPLFDVFDENGISFGNGEYYQGTSFVGSKLFNYGVDVGIDDPILGFPLRYSSVDNVGDISFDVSLNTDTFDYVVNTAPITKSVNAGYVYNYSTRTSYTRQLGWQTAAGDSVQYQVFTFDFNIANPTTTFVCDVPLHGYTGIELRTKVEGENAAEYAIQVNDFYLNCLGRYAEQASLDYWVGLLVSNTLSVSEVETLICGSPEALNPAWKNTPFPSVKVFVNNQFQLPSSYSVATDVNSTTITLVVDSAISTRVQVLLLSNTVSENAYYTIPINLSNNPFNTDIATVNIGDIRSQYQSIFYNAPNITGQMFGANNFRDLGNLVPYGTNIIQNSSSLVAPASFLRLQNHNFFDALLYNSRKYINFKSLLVDTVAQITMNQTYTPSTVLDNALDVMNGNKTDTQSFYWSDMIPSKSAYVTNSYTFKNIFDTSIFPLTQTYDYTKANYNGVLVYVFRTITGVVVEKQLVKDIDYVISADAPSVTVTYDLQPNDIVTIKEYNQTYGSFVPNTPTKLGLYPSFEPKIILDNSYATPTYFIVGHDGSYNKLYGTYNTVLGSLVDFRDQALLEFEKRVYNNLKLSTEVLIRDYEILPGFFRDTILSQDDFLQIYSESFLNWVGTNRLNYKSQLYDANNEFSYNYWQSGNALNNEVIFQGFWRGVYQYFYDTSTPDLTPWEMVGLVEKPSWWETRYGPAPYTSDNLVLWNDMADGVVWNNNDPYVVQEAIRPNLLDLIPVNSAGDLLSPLNSVVGAYTDTLFKRDWKVGDVAPVEYSYRKSSTWPFDLIRIFALTKPAEFFNLGIDLDNYKYNAEFNQYLVNDRSHLVLENVQIYGNGTAKTSYINWIVDYEKQVGISSTTNITNLLKNLDVRLVYRMAGFSDKTFLQFFVEKGTPNSVNASLLIPDESYALLLYENQPFDRIVYSSIVVQIVNNGYAVFGNSQNIAYFTTLTPINNGNVDNITVEGITVKVANDYNSKKIIVPYGTIFNSVQDVAQFIGSYGAYLQSQGLLFDEIENGIEINFRQLTGEFIYWALTGWEIGNIVTLNPAANKLYFNKDSNIVQPLTIQRNNFILNQNLYPIQVNDLSIERYQTEFIAKPLNGGDAISYAQFSVSNFEHGIVFDNTTLFDDTIYNLITGLRQDRILLKGVKTAEWNGTVTASGFILNQDNILEWDKTKAYTKGEIVKYKNKYWVSLKKLEPNNRFDELGWKQTDYNEIQKGLLPNSSTRSYESALYYNVNQANLEQDSNLLAYSLIGYRPRDYLATVDLTDTAQVQIYKNFIRNKGTKIAVDTFRGAQLPQGGIKYDVYENWAIKTADFGGTLNDNFFEVRLSENQLTGNPSILSLTNGIPTVGAQQYVPLYQLYNYAQPINNVDVLPTIDSYTPSEIYPTAGFVNFNDVRMSAYFYNNLPAAVDNEGTIVPITNFYVGDYVWIANFKSTWQVYSWQPIGRVISMRGNLNATTTIRFSNTHNLSRLDPISIINFDNAANGYYFVTTVVNPYEVIINLTLDVNNNVLTGQGIGLKFTSQKVQNPSDIVNLNLLQSEFIKNKVWVETDTDGGWAVYRKSLNYSQSNSFTESNTDNFGSSVAYNDKFGYLVGDSNSGIVYRYYPDPVTGEVELVQQLSKSASFGTSISYFDNFVAISEPTNSKVYIYVTNTDSAISNNLTQIQEITNTGSSSNFGSAIDFSRDGNYLYVSEIYNSISTNDRVYVYVKENIPLGAGYFVKGQVYTITSVGTTDFTLIGATENLVGLTFVATGVGTGTGTANQITYKLSPYNSGYITAPTVQIDFGHSLATDYNGDTLIVGAPGYDYDINTSNFGRSYVYNRTTQQFEVQYNSVLYGYQTFVLGWTPNQVSTTVVSTNATTDKILVNYVAGVITNVISIVVGTDYKILSLGTTTQLQWNTLAGTTGVTYAVGSTFTAAQVGVGTGKVYKPLLPVIFTGNLLDSLVQEYKVYFIDTIEEVTPGVTFTVKIKEDRNSATILPIATETFTTTPYVYFQTNDLQVTKNGTIVQNNSYGVVGNRFIYTSPLLAGDLLTVGDSKLNLIQTLEASSTPSNGVSFGYSVDTTRYGSELLVGAPYDLNNQTQEGSVYRYTNAGGKYGLIIGTSTVNVTANRKIYLNGFEVIITSGSNANDVVSIINGYNLPNIQASSSNGILMIGVIDSNRTVPNEKLLLSVYDNATTTLSELGITIYTETQTILCPHIYGATQFGSAIKFNESDSVVISAPVGTRYSFTSFDFSDDESFINDTVFDNNATQFVDENVNAGAVYMFDYLPAYNENINNTGNFVYAQSINDNSQSYGPSPKYGASLDFNTNKVIVGSPYYSVGSTDGKVNIFNNTFGVKDWAIYRTSSDVVDINRIQNIQIYDLTTNNTLSNLDYIDPLQGKILGAARQNLDYISNVDPAKYNSPDSIVTGMIWGPENVGQLWFNTNNVRFVNYHQNDVKYNSKYWATVFPGSDVAVYSWVASPVPPNQYVGPGTVLDVTQYVQEPVLNAANQLSVTYYFWVRDTNIIFTQANKTLADSVVASYIKNPIQSGISYFEPLLPNTYGLYNIQQYLNGTTSVLHVGYTTGRSSDVPHSEYTLIRSDFADDFLPGVPSTVSNPNIPIYNQEPTGLYARFLASLSGTDTDGQVVPDFFLPPAVQSGIQVRPRQSFFYDRLLALKNYIQYANVVMKQFPIMEIKPDLSLLYRSFSLGTRLDTTISGPLAEYYATLVNNYYVECIGRYADQGGLDFWVNILVNNLATTEEVRGLICSSPEALQGRKTPYDVTNYWTTINWWATGFDDNTKAAYQVPYYADLATLSVPRGTIVLVGQNIGSQEYYIYEPDLNVGTELTTTVVGANATNYATLVNEMYLTCLGSYAEQAGLDYWVTVLVNGLATLNEVESYICSSPEALDNTANPNWRRIGLQNGTIEFSDYLYDYSAAKIGFGDNFFDTNDFDQYPSLETYFIVRALCEQIYTEDLLIFRNKSLVLLFDFIQSETIESQNYLPWLNKTSLVDVSHTIRELLPYENYKTDNQAFLESYITEVKPYHVVIKDFLLKYTGSEIYEGNVSDFDLPSQYSVTEQQFISPMLVYSTPTETNQYLPTSLIWDTVPYKQWFQNKGVSLQAIPEYPATVLDSYIDLSSNFLYADNVYGFPVNGTIKIGSELIGYNAVDSASNKLSQLVRGLDGTEISTHIPGDQILLNLPPVVVLYAGRAYLEPPKITVSYDTSTYPAPSQYIELEPIMNNDQLLSVNVINPGQGYMVAPVINVEPSVVAAFSYSDVNVTFNVVRIFAPELQTGDLIQYKSGSSTGVIGLENNQWYYINVLSTQPSSIIAFYATLQDATLDTHRIVFYGTGDSTDQTINLGARLVPTLTSSPTRELNTTLRFDRTSYRPQVTDWAAGTFYAGEIAGTNGLVSYASSSIKLESTLPPINNILASSTDEVLVISDITSDTVVTFSEFPRRVVGTNSGSNTIVLLPYDDSAGFSTASGSTFGFTIGMPIIFQGPLQGGIAPNTRYYVASIVSNTEFTISQVQFGPVYTLSTSTIPVIPGAKAYAGKISDTAILDVYYPRIQQVTSISNNRVYSIPTAVGTAGTTPLYSGVSLIFTGTEFGNIQANENYYVSAVFDDESFTVSHHETTTRTTISQTNSSNIITVSSTTGFAYNDPLVFTDFVITAGNFVIGDSYTILSLSNTDYTLLGSDYNLVGTTFTATATGTVTAGSFVPGLLYTIVSVGTTDFTSIGATSNTVGVKFIATGIGTGTGTASQGNGTASTTTFGGLTSGTFYYVASIINSTQLSVSQSLGGDVVALSNQNGTGFLYNQNNIDNLVNSVGNMTMMVALPISPGIVNGQQFTIYETTKQYPNLTPTNTELWGGTILATIGSPDSTAYKVALEKPSASVNATDYMYYNMPLRLTSSSIGGLSTGTTYYVVDYSGRANLQTGDVTPNLTVDVVGTVAPSTLKCLTAENLYVGMPIVFSGTGLGGVEIGTEYFIKTISYTPGDNSFTISETLGGSTFTVTSSVVGIMRGVGDQYIKLSTSVAGSPVALTQAVGSETIAQTSATLTSPTVSLSSLLGGYRAIITDQGAGYTISNLLTISGTVMGGTSPENDCTLYVSAVDSFGGITNVIVSGTPPISSTDYYVKVVGANQLALFSDPLLQSPVTGKIVEVAGSFTVGQLYTITYIGSTNWNSIGYVGTPIIGGQFVASGIGSGTGTASTSALSYTGFTNESIEFISYEGTLPYETNKIRLTNPNTDQFVVNDQVFFSGTIGGGITAYKPYYIESITTDYLITISETPGGSTLTLTTFIADNTMFITKLGSIAYKQAPILYNQSLVRYNNRVWECLISNNDDEFVIGKWELIDSDSRKLNALDRVVGYYSPTVNMPGINLPQLMTGLEYPNTTYYGNKFDPAEQFNVETNLQGQEFYPYGYTNTSIINDGSNIIITTNSANNSSLLLSADGANYEIDNLTIVPIDFTDIVYSGTKYIITTADSNAPMLESTDGLTWTVNDNISSITTDPINAIMYYNGKYVAAGKNVYTSTNGSTWAEAFSWPGSRPTTLLEAKKITLSSTNYYTVVGEGQIVNVVTLLIVPFPMFFYSSNAVNWSIGLPDSRYNNYSVACDGTNIITVGENGIISRSTDLINWYGVNETYAFSVNVATNVLNVTSTAGFQVGDSVRFSTAFDVINTTTTYTISQIVSSTQVRLTSITFLTSPTVESYMYLYPQTSNLNSVEYANGKFIAVGDLYLGEGLIKVSTNSTTWSIVSSGVPHNLNSITYDAVNSLWIAVGDNNVIITSSDNGVTWDKNVSFNIPEPIYTVQGDTFLSGYGPEEMVPGIVEDNLTMIVNTRPGTNWPATSYQHVGYNVVSTQVTPNPSAQTEFSFANLVTVPAQLSLFVIDGTTGLSTSIYVTNDYIVDWVTQTITLNSSLAVGDSLRIDVYEVGNGDQLVKSNTFEDPIRLDENTGFNEIYLNCNYSQTITNGSGLIQDLPYTSTTICTQTESTYNTITVNDVSIFTLNIPVKFQGPVFGGIVAGTTYYVKFINAATNSIVISATISGGIAGPAFVLTNATGSMTAIVSTGAGVPWTDPYVTHNGTKLIVGRTNLALATSASTNAVTTNSTGGIAAGDTIIFDDNMFGVLVPQTSYNILNIVDSTRFRIENPSSPGNPLTLTNASGRSVFVTKDYAIGIQPNSTQAKVVFSNQYDDTTDYLAYSFFGETEPEQYGYTIPETEVFTATAGQTVFSLANYAAYDNETDAIVEVNGLRVSSGYTIDFGTSTLTFSTGLSLNDIVAVTTFNQTFRQYLNTQFNIQGLVTSITSISAGPNYGAQITVSTTLGLSNGDAIRIGGVTGTTQINDRTLYVYVVNPTNYELYTDPGLLAQDAVTSYSPFTGTGFAWADRTFVLATTTTTKTFATVNRIGVNSIDKLIPNTPIYFTSPATVNNDVLVGGLVDNDLYWILDVGPSIAAGSFIIGESYIIEDLGTTTNWNSIGYIGVPVTGGEFTATGIGSGDGTAFAKSITVSETQEGSEYVLTNGTGTVNLSQFKQDNVDRLWVTVNGYRVPSNKLQIYNNNFVGIEYVLSNVSDYVTIESMMPSATPNQEVYFNNVGQLGVSSVYKTTVNTNTWLTEDLENVSSVITVDDVAKLIQNITSVQTVPALSNGVYTLLLNQLSSIILAVSVYNDTLSIAIPDNIITQTFDGNQPILEIANNPTYINAGDTVTVTIVVGGLVYINGEQIKFGEYDTSTNELSQLTRGVNHTPILTFVPKYTTIYGIFNSNKLPNEYYDVTWNSTNTYDTDLTNPLQISDTYSAEFLKDG